MLPGLYRRVGVSAKSPTPMLATGSFPLAVCCVGVRTSRFEITAEYSNGSADLIGQLCADLIGQL